MGSQSKVECPWCKGYGKIMDVIDSFMGSSWGPEETCEWCDGSGKVTKKQKMEYVRSFIKKKGKCGTCGDRLPTEALNTYEGKKICRSCYEK